jgi:hypothetical protein
MDGFLLTMMGLGGLLALMMLSGPDGWNGRDSGGSGEDGFNCPDGDAGGDGGGD